MISFTINGRLPGLNEYTKACRKNRYAGNQMKQVSQQVCEYAIVQQCKGKHIDSCKVKIKWIESNKKRDLDNISFAKKFIFDALVKQNVLDNDGWEQIRGIEETFDVDRVNPRIEVELHEQTG